MQTEDAPRQCDLVLDGGGVKGIGLVGAVDELAKRGYRFQRVAGTSAGAIVGSLVAAGMPADELERLMCTVDYRNFQDEGFLDRLGWLGKLATDATEYGVYEGDFLQEFLSRHLAARGVRTFADLRLEDAWAQELPPQRRYRLVVTATDLSRGTLICLPWDYRDYGLEPDEQLVAEAVRASMSIPFLYEPVTLAGSYLVDGGMLAFFPVGLFDDTPRWPTFGVKLSSQLEARGHQIDNDYDYVHALIGTTVNAHDRLHVGDPCTRKRTMFVDTGRVDALNFAITEAQQKKLYQNGRLAATDFLRTWDFDSYLAQCR